MKNPFEETKDYSEPQEVQEAAQVLTQCRSCNFLDFLDYGRGRLELKEGYRLEGGRIYHKNCTSPVSLFRMASVPIAVEVV